MSRDRGAGQKRLEGMDVTRQRRRTKAVRRDGCHATEVRGVHVAKCRGQPTHPPSPMQQSIQARTAGYRLRARHACDP
eukprot:344698-Chlamydomonas_euryale.AAC.3